MANWAEQTKHRGGAAVDTISELTSGAGVTADGVLLKDSQVTTDVINEKTPAAGVTIDGVIIKDGGITATGTNNINLTAISADTINETTPGNGVSVDGVLLKDSQVTTDVILEKTSAAGVTIDGMLIKDGQTANANIANDGTADSPRGYASITSTGTFTVTKGGASLYRVAVSSPAAPITATLPTDVKAGYRVRFEVELTSSTETNCFFTSPSIAEAQINGTGFVELMALKDNPSVAGDWKVLDVEETTPAMSVTPTGAWTTACNWSLSRRKSRKTVTFTNTGSLAAAIGTNNNITYSGLPTRFAPTTPSAVRPWVVCQNGSIYQTGHLLQQATGAFVIRNLGVANFTGNIHPFGNSAVEAQLEYV